MKVFRFVVFVVVFCVLFSSVVHASGTNVVIQTFSAQNISAEAAVIFCCNNSRVIYSKEQSKQLPMASTTKIMTAIVVIENCSLDSVIKISPIAVGVEGSSMYLYKDELVTVETLLYGLMLQSANDAATALAVHCAGDIDSFAQMMNDKAKAIGMKDTHFANPHGLDDETHYSTAYDMALLMTYAMKNDTFRCITSEYKFTSKMTGLDQSRLFINHNRLLKSYDGCIGGKTGYTKRSGRCLVSVAQREDLMFVCVTLNAPNDWNDHTRLFDMAYEQYQLFAFDKCTYNVPVINGESSAVKAEAESITFVLNKESYDKIISVCQLERFYYASIKKGQTLGTITYCLGDEIIGSVEIKAIESVKNITHNKSFWQKILSIFIKD